MENFKKKLLYTKAFKVGGKYLRGLSRPTAVEAFLKKFDKKNLLLLLKWGIFVIIPLLILTPEIRIFSPAIRLDEVVLLFLVIIYGLYKLKVKKIRVSVVDYLFAALFSSVVVSIAFSYIREGGGFYFGDAFELAKIIKYYLLYRILFIINWKRGDLSRVIRVVVISFVLSVSFSFFQYFNIFDVNNNLMQYFTKPYHIRVILNAGRVVGTFKNANSWALVLGLPLFYIFATLISKLENKGNHIKEGMALLFFLFVVLTSGIMTMGRTATVANSISLFIISFALWFFPYKKIGKPRIAKEIFLVFSIFTIMSVMAFAFVTYIPNKKGTMTILDRFDAGFQEMGLVEEDVGASYQSWSSRVVKWGDVLRRSAESPIFGYGPSKSPESPDKLDYIVDNEYLLYFYRYGLLGLVLYLGLFGIFIYYGVINLKNTIINIDVEFMINIVALGLSISYPLFNILAGSFYDFQLFPLYIIFNALNIYILNKHEKK